MSTPQATAPGIEVHEHVLNAHEQGFLSGVFQALADRTLTEEEFRLLVAQVTDSDN